jgi:pyrroline-5-carboxylate reductase
MSYQWFFLGSGNMARAFMQGLLKAGIRAEQLFALSHTGVSSKQCQKDLGVTHLDTLPKLGRGDICVLAMKPQQFETLEKKDFYSIGAEAIVISIMAGVETQNIQSKMASSKIIRHMPNLAVAVNAQGATSAFAPEISTEEKRYFEQLFQKLGHNTNVCDEKMISDSTVHCSSMLAHHFDVAHKIAIDLEALGFDPDEARLQAIMSFQAAAQLMLTSTRPLLELKETVVSKAGVTYAFLQSLEENAFSEAFSKALEDAKARSRELRGASKESM